MKYIEKYHKYNLKTNKKFESKNYCQRCGKKSFILAPSIYNEQKICLDCKKDELSGKVTGDDLRDLNSEIPTSNILASPEELGSATKSQLINNL